MGQTQKLHKKADAVLDQYFATVSVNPPEDERAAIVALARDVQVIGERLLSLATKRSKKGNLLFAFHLTADPKLSPQASSVQGSDSRVCVPISLLSEAWRHALPFENIRKDRPEHIDDYRSLLTRFVAIIAIGHELNHVFSDHLHLPSTMAQEVNSDLRAGGYVAGLYKNTRVLDDLLGVTENEMVRANLIVESALILAVIFTPIGGQTIGNYPSPACRFASIVAGFINFAERYQLTVLAFLPGALLLLKRTASSAYTNSLHAETVAKILNGPTAYEDALMTQVAKQADIERKEWYSMAHQKTPAIARLLKRFAKKSGGK